jgi:hypothetical protein
MRPAVGLKEWIFIHGQKINSMFLHGITHQSLKSLLSSLYLLNDSDDEKNYNYKISPERIEKLKNLTGLTFEEFFKPLSDEKLKSYLTIDNIKSVEYYNKNSRCWNNPTIDFLYKRCVSLNLKEEFDFITEKIKMSPIKLIPISSKSRKLMSFQIEEDQDKKSVYLEEIDQPKNSSQRETIIFMLNRINDINEFRQTFLEIYDSSDDVGKINIFTTVGSKMI